MTIRKFSPGSEWMYFKLYCGVKTADSILQEVITPLVLCLIQKKLVKNWFFIRYNDPKPHLRLRFQLLNIKNYITAFEIINSRLNKYVDSREIINISMDTYIRELERYGNYTIDFAEDLFCKSSNLVLNFLEYDDEEKMITSLFYFEQLLSKIRFSSAEKLDFINISNIAFKQEFNAGKILNAQLKQKFLDFKPKYDEFIVSDEFEEVRNLVFNSISESSYILEKLIEGNPTFSSAFFSSIFHMHINRTFMSNQRLFEMIIYDYLFRYNK